MSSILSAFKGKKGEKEFQNLGKEELEKVLQAAIDEKVSKISANEIANSMISGMQLELEHLYKQFVLKIDSCDIDSVEWYAEIDKLLSHLRTKHLEYLKKKGEQKT